MLADQAAKYIFLKTPVLSEGVFLNQNFAWGIPISNNMTLGLMLLAVVILVFAVMRSKSRAFTPLLLILAGAISNIIDRIVYKGVVDYIFVPWGGIINLADVMIFVGVVLLILESQTGKKNNFN